MAARVCIAVAHRPSTVAIVTLRYLIDNGYCVFVALTIGVVVLNAVLACLPGVLWLCITFSRPHKVLIPVYLVRLFLTRISFW